MSYNVGNHFSFIVAFSLQSVLLPGNKVEFSLKGSMIDTFSVNHIGQTFLCYSELVRFYCPSVIRSGKLFRMIVIFLIERKVVSYVS